MSTPNFFIAFQPERGGRRYWSGSTFRGPDMAVEFPSAESAQRQIDPLKADPERAGVRPGYSEWLGHCSDLFVTTELV